MRSASTSSTAYSSTGASGSDPFAALARRLAKLPVSVEELGIAEELALFGDSVLRRAPDSYLGQILESFADDLEAMVLTKPCVEPHSEAGLDAGDIPILLTSNRLPVRVSFEEGRPVKVDHLAILGQSGSGKSCLQAVIACGAAQTCSTFIIDVNRFFRRVPAMFDRHAFVRWEDLRINIFDLIPGMEANQQDQVMVSELCRSYGLQFAELEIMRIVEQLRSEGTPNLVSVLAALEGTRVTGWSKRRHYLDSAILVVSNLLHATDQLFRCEQGMPVGQLLAGNIVLELDGLLPRHAAFLVRFLFQFLHLQSIARQGERE